MRDSISVSLDELLAALPEGSFRLRGNRHQVIEAITWDYKRVCQNTLYFCLEDEEFQEKHIETNSLDYWQEATEAGAVCLVVSGGRISQPPEGICLVEVDWLNGVMALLARQFYGDPLSEMKVVGITGTNGKTTTSQLVDSVLLRAGYQTGVIGTIGVFYPSGREEASHLSNPMATELFSIGRRMRGEGVDFLTMEVTSHAGAFDRNEAIDFDIAVFTNLTQDHLDYHKTIESYKKAKLKHFQRLGTGDKKAYGIINIDDASGIEFESAIDPQARRSGNVEVLTYGIRNKDADLVAYPRQMTGAFSEFDVFLKGNHLCLVSLPMPGLFNIYNGLAAFGTAFALGIGIEMIAEGLRNARKVDGRFERVECKADYDVYVDYAHTPDALEKILREIQAITKQRVIVVFGCGGDRDNSKRSIMGRVASEIADVCVVTSDNPRSEEPGRIIEHILKGVPSDIGPHLFVEEDRRKAIHLALEMASAEDSVLIAGKGHEDYQIIGKTKFPFSDRKVVRDFFFSRPVEHIRAWIEIDMSALRENWRLLFEEKPEKLKVMAVVKDNALGHGMIEMAEEAIEAGCHYLGVSCLREALDARREFPDIPILVFGERFDDEIELCVKENLSLQIQSREKAALIGHRSVELNRRTRVHLKVDTGMGRFGVHWREAVELFRAVGDIPGVEVEGLMTHFAQSDEADKEYANTQWERFQHVRQQLEREGISPPLVHACNSGGYLDLPFAHADMVRMGILPTGVYPSKVCRRTRVGDHRLKPVMSVFTRIAFLKRVRPGDCVGYGMHFTADRETTIAVLPVGYGDGYPRLRNVGHVLIRGQQAPIVGGNGMDATMVDVTAIPGLKAGETVVLLGTQEGQEIPATRIADWAGTVTYDILSGWSSRMVRIFV